MTEKKGVREVVKEIEPEVDVKDILWIDPKYRYVMKVVVDDSYTAEQIDQVTQSLKAILGDKFSFVVLRESDKFDIQMFKLWSDESPAEKKGECCGGGCDKGPVKRPLITWEHP